MPLTLTEYNALIQHLNAILQGQPAQQVVTHRPTEHVDTGPMVADALDRFAGSLDRLTTWLEKVAKQVEQEQHAAPAETPKRTRKPAEKGNGQVASPQTPATLPETLGGPAPTPQAVATPTVQVAPAPQPASQQEDMPDFLKRPAAGGPAASVSPVPPQTASPAPAPTPAPATGPLTEEQVKVVLRDYMAKHGPDGPDKIGALLKKHGAEQFSALPKDKWSAIVADAQSEMRLM